MCSIERVWVSFGVLFEIGGTIIVFLRLWANVWDTNKRLANSYNFLLLLRQVKTNITKKFCTVDYFFCNTLGVKSSTKLQKSIIIVHYNVAMGVNPGLYYLFESKSDKLWSVKKEQSGWSPSNTIVISSLTGKIRSRNTFLYGRACTPYCTPYWIISGILLPSK